MTAFELRPWTAPGGEGPPVAPINARKLTASASEAADRLPGAGGQPHVLYDESPYPELAKALVRDGRYPNLEIRLPHNNTAVLWIRQTAPSRTSWSIHELRLWRYDSSGGIR